MLTLPDWTEYSQKWERMLTRGWDLGTQRVQLEKAMTFRFGNDETQETRALAILIVGIVGVNGVLRVWYLVAHRSCNRNS